MARPARARPARGPEHGNRSHLGGRGATRSNRSRAPAGAHPARHRRRRAQPAPLRMGPGPGACGGRGNHDVSGLHEPDHSGGTERRRDAAGSRRRGRDALRRTTGASRGQARRSRPPGRSGRHTRIRQQRRPRCRRRAHPSASNARAGRVQHPGRVLGTTVRTTGSVADRGGRPLALVGRRRRRTRQCHPLSCSAQPLPSQPIGHLELHPDQRVGPTAARACRPVRVPGRSGARDWAARPRCARPRRVCPACTRRDPLRKRLPVDVRVGPAAGRGGDGRPGDRTARGSQCRRPADAGCGGTHPQAGDGDERCGAGADGARRHRGRCGTGHHLFQVAAVRRGFAA
ncbi:MAG: hypothetical protein JWP07_3930 [Pseudonocardiales bacterium]|nr:hypothetical protein [Pseudonocardiales bacterium]